MFIINGEEKILLIALGERLRSMRLQRNEKQGRFAQRIGISRMTYAKLEKGDPTVAIGYWIRVTFLLDCAHEWDSLLQQQDLFALYDFQQSQQKRAKKRVSRRKAKHAKT